MIFFLNSLPFFLFLFFSVAQVLGEYWFGEKIGGLLSYLLFSYYLFPICIVLSNLLFLKKNIWVRILTSIGVIGLFYLFSGVALLLSAKIALELGLEI